MNTLNTLLKPLIAIAIFAVVISCESITNPKPIPAIDTTKTATIIGTAFANTDTTNDDSGITYEKAPAETKITVVLNASDFSNSASPDQKLTYSTTVDGSGNYMIEVPALYNAINGEVYPASFTVDGNQKKIYSSGSSPVTITADVTTSVDIYYALQ